MSINEKQRVIDVNCIDYNTDFFFLGYANDVNYTVLRFIIDPKYLVSGLSYRLVFDREDGTTPITCSPTKDVITQEITQTVPTSVLQGLTENLGHIGHFQFFVIEGENVGEPVTFLYSSAKFAYKVEDNLKIGQISQEDVPDTLWDDLEQAISFINSFMDQALCYVRKGTLTSSTALDNAEFCIVGAVYQFVASTALAVSIGITPDSQCEMRYVNGYQVITRTDTQQIYARKINTVAPSFSAEDWVEVVDPRITTLEPKVARLNNATINNYVVGVTTQGGIQAIVGVGDSFSALGTAPTKIYIPANWTNILTAQAFTSLVPGRTFVVDDSINGQIFNPYNYGYPSRYSYDISYNYDINNVILGGLKDMSSRIATLESTVGTLNTQLENALNGGV